MSYCPKCLCFVYRDAKSCESCSTLFEEGGLQPQDTLPKIPKQVSAAGAIVRLGIASVIIPATAFVLGWVLVLLIPGCHCDEGAGCSGCGENGLVGFLVFNGFIGAFVALLTLLPGSLLLAGIVAAVSRRQD